jgi:ABC-type sugar transport system ATPase subunit
MCRTAYDNVTLADFAAVARGGFLSRRRSSARAEELLQRVGFRGRIAEPVRNLSGGNQQKVMLARWLHRGPPVLLIDEPTRGVDIGAKVEIMRVIRELARSGHGVVWVSSELEEVVSVSDRILLMSGGSLVGELTPPQATLSAVLAGLFKTTEAAVAAS